MNVYIGQTISEPFYLDLHLFKFHFEARLQNHALSGFGVFDEMDNLIKDFRSYNEAINYCQDMCYTIVD